MSAREVFDAIQADYAGDDPVKLLRYVSTFLSNKKKAGVLRALANNGDVVRYVVA